jgi:uncharacterized membrane protein YeaQ/YmgE (transglycosylase-associated protein family)
VIVMRGLADPALSLLIILVIGIVAGLIYDRLAGPGWLTRQVAGSRRGIVTSSLVGIAGAFIGFHLAAVLKLAAAGGLALYIGAVIGAAVVLWLWRMTR